MFIILQILYDEEKRATIINLFQFMHYSTRKAILEACMALIQEKEFQKITIHEIAEREDINRGTFYLHFADKYEMMNRFEEEMIEKVEKAIVENLPVERTLH